MKQTLLIAALAGFAFAANAQETQTVKFADVADSWVRSNNETFQDNNADKLEYHAVDADNSFYALIGFEYQVPEGMKVEKATLHFVTERVRGGETSIRGYARDFSDKTNWKTEKDAIQAALEQTPLYTARIAGVSGTNTTINSVTESKFEDWCNAVDVTDYVKGIRGTRVNFLFSVDDQTKTGQNCIFTKDLDNTTAPEIASDKEDLKPYLEVVFTEDTALVTSKISPLSDTEIRKGNDRNHGGSDQMEIKNFTKADGSASGTFYGLMEFALPSEIFDTKNYEVQSVSLRLFHKMVKGSTKINIHAYNDTFVESTGWSTEQEKIESALSAEPIATYVANGQGGKACWDAGIKDEYLKAEAWRNDINLTSYVRSLLLTTRALPDNNIALLLSKAETDASDNAIRISTKEATDINANGDEHPGVTFAKDDIVPLLTVSYIKKGEITGVTVATEENAVVEYYNLNGMKVNGSNLAPGLYIKRQGAKTVKIMVK